MLTSQDNSEHQHMQTAMGVQLHATLGIFLLSVLALQLPHSTVAAELAAEEFARAADDSLAFLGAQQSGEVSGVIWAPAWRSSSGMQYQAATSSWYNDTINAYVNQTVNLSGGFYSGGEVGPVKLTTSIATTTAFLAWSALEYKEFWDSDPDRKRLMVTVLRHGAAYVAEIYAINPAAAEYDFLYFLVRFRFYFFYMFLIFNG